MAQAALVYTTLPDRETAKRLARSLIGRGLAACANITDITSVYAWEGSVEEGAEIGVLFKTRAELIAQLVEALESDHPYDTPAILAWRVDQAAEATLNWLQKETGGT